MFFSFCAGLVYANAGEWFIHRYVLHGLGKKKDSFWSFHWKEHHNACRKHNMLDHAYSNTTNDVKERKARLKETLGLISLAAIHMPLLFISPGFVFGVWTSIIAYYNLHKMSHVKPEWAKKWLPWHYRHHMAKDQDKNWCVSWPLFDIIMKTTSE